MLAPLKFNPGINREGTTYSNQGGWYFCDKIRFRSGLPEKIGGWLPYIDENLQGVARGILITATLNGTKNDAIGTNLKYYVINGGSLIDITPIRYTSDPMATNPFDPTNGSPIVTVTDVNHGAEVGDFVTYEDATTFASFTTDEINANHQITEIIDNDTYTITMPHNANSGTAGGGAVVIAEYEIHIGLDSQVSGPGWGAGVWGGTQGWGEPADVDVTGQQMRLWTQLAYGEDIAINPRGGEIYLWDASNPSARAVAISTLPTASDTPTAVNEIMIADNSRQVFAFGVNPLGEADLDPMFIRWAAFEDIGQWTPLPDNAAGGIRLSQGSKIITASQSNQEIIVFTDSALFSLRNSGYPYYWGALLVSTGQSIIGPNAKATVNQTIFWMGTDNFYMYNGNVQTLPCSLKDFVFSNLNTDQSYKVYCGINSQFNEVWWFYPSQTGSGENDSYVKFNYVENAWDYGTMERTVWADAGIENNPLSVDPDGQTFSHEIGVDDGSTQPASPIMAYIQTSQFEMDAGGNSFIFANRVIPDVTFRPGITTSVNPTVEFIFYPQDYPGASTKTPSNSPVIQGTVTTTIEEFTEQAWIRLRARSMMFRLECNNLGVSFRLGTPRLDIRPDGRR